MAGNKRQTRTPPPATPPHIAVIPAAGMGHLNPFLRLASMLLSRNCEVTLITSKSFVSAAESNHISFFRTAHPQVKHLEFETVSIDHNQSNDDPFFLQYEAINRSGHLLVPLLSSSSPPFSAVFCDLLVGESVASSAADLHIPYYILITSSARFLAFMVHLPVLDSNNGKLSTNSTEVEIPGLGPVPISSIPPPFLIPSHILARNVLSQLGALMKARGLVINTFDRFEAEALSALNSGRVSRNLPPVLAVGPLETYEQEKQQSPFLLWLDNQPSESVVYVNFGSRTAMSIEQIRELRDGLDRSGFRFLWVLKTQKVDKDDTEDLKSLLGESFLERTKDKGMVVKGWVNQQEMLAHPAIAGFISHCGWNSVVEAAQRGVPVLAWPQHGDQMMNAEVVQKSGLGVLERTWGMGFENLVKGEEIAKKIAELMEDPIPRSKARKIGEAAKKATELGGSSEETIRDIIESLS